MGLSDNERHQKVIWGVHRCTILAAGIKEDNSWYYDSTNPYKAIKKLVEQMWPILLSGNCNSAMWLLGSDENVEPDKISIWSLGLYDNIKYCNDPKDKNNWTEEKRKEDVDRSKYLWDVVGDYLTIKNLLQGDNKIIYEIKQWVEYIQYASNRYDDNVSEQYKELNIVIAKILGHMFNIFTNDKQWAKAWLLEEVCKTVIGNTSYVRKEEATPIQKYVTEHYQHHVLKEWMNREVWEIRRHLQSLTRDSSEKNKVRVLIAMLKDKINNEKDMNALVELAKGVGISWKAPTIKPKKDQYNLKEYEENRKSARERLVGLSDY